MKSIKKFINFKKFESFNLNPEKELVNQLDSCFI